ncbi:MAG TPA: aminotransferase class I/II-fold pyridoxal phosphate-dependent enzyme [Actinomycetes bacterium]|nr:aminotransferase class I/II-fold pyridoxal phosphate-dependent enzyme [Actinomycetes bacterium]
MATSHDQAVRARSPGQDPDDPYPPVATLAQRIRPATHLDFQGYSTPRDGALSTAPADAPLRRLDLNEGPAAPPELVEEWLERLKVRALHVYPDEHASTLRAAVAGHVGVEPDQVAVGAGSVQLYQAVPLAFAGPGRTALVFTPTYGAYFPTVRSTGTRILARPLGRSARRFDAMPWLAAETGADLVICCSPNNPTGEVIPNDVIADLCAATDGIVMVDEAYGEFGSSNATALLPRFPNLIVTGSTSKAFSLAFLRAGWATARAEITSVLAKVQTPWHISGPAELAATLALTTYRDEIAANVKDVMRERDRLAVELPRIHGVEEVLPSEGNFVAFRTSRPATDTWAELLAMGIQIRNLSHIMEDPNYLRVSVTNIAADTDAFMRALAEVLGGGALGGPRSPRPSG